MRLTRSVRFRVTVLSTVLVAATLTIAALVVMSLVRADLLDSAEATLQDALAEQVAEDGLSPGLAFEDPTFTNSVVPIEIDGQIAELGLFTEEVAGRAFGDLTIDEVPIARVVLDLETGELDEVLDPFTDGLIDDPELRDELENLLFQVYEPDLFAPPPGVGETGAVPLLVGVTPLDEIGESIDALQRALLTTLPLLVAGFAAMSWLLAGRALRPVHAISDRVREISTSSLDQRVPVPDTRDEVSELATLMNEMLGRLEAGGARQRRFSADASHELRSPLSTVRAAAELIEREGASERATRLADEIVTESDRMDELIGDLLALARLDEDPSAAPTEPVDVAEIVTAEATRIGRDTACTVDVVVPDAPVVAAGVPQQLRRLATNLIDNACRHADRRVVVRVAPDADANPLLVVDDDGPGVPADVREQIFERFSRLDQSRDRREGGTGLGLALVRAIANRHGATVTVGDADLGGARFTVRFPAGGS